MMGRISFGDAVYLVLTGDLPSPDVSRIVEALMTFDSNRVSDPGTSMTTLLMSWSGATSRLITRANDIAPKR